jgi:hypothetical protein
VWGDTIEFGQYENTLEWRVLDVQDGRALILCESIIMSRKWSDANCVNTWDKCDVIWEVSDIRKYLNETLYDIMFNNNEKNLIVETLIFNDDNPQFNTSGGNDTVDKIFLLSIDEADKYFSNDSSRVVLDNWGGI